MKTSCYIRVWIFEHVTCVYLSCWFTISYLHIANLIWTCINRTIRFVIPFSILYVLKYPTQASMEDLVFYAGGSLYQGLKLYEFQLWNGTWPWRSTPSLSFNCEVAQTSFLTCFALNFSFVAKLSSLIGAKKSKKHWHISKSSQIKIVVCT